MVEEQDCIANRSNIGHGSDTVPHRNFTAPQLGMSQTGQTEQRDGCHQKYFFQHNCLCQDL